VKAASVEELRTWQEAYSFKLAVYKTIEASSFDQHRTLRDQLRDAAASAVSQMEEGFGRFYPKDHARMVVGARASLKECRGHLRDAHDRGLISSEVRTELDTTITHALREIGGLLDYLQSPEAEENARRIKARRAERRKTRRGGTPNP
jgi:four helix bundle protein